MSVLHEEERFVSLNPSELKIINPLPKKDHRGGEQSVES